MLVCQLALGALILAAWRGEAREASTLIETTTHAARSRGEGIGLTICEYARAVLLNGFGRYEEALAAARSASEHQEVVGENWGLSELVEAATRTGRLDLATDALGRLSKKAQASRWGVVPRTEDPILPAAKIRRLENEFIPKELQRDYAKTFGHDRH